MNSFKHYYDHFATIVNPGTVPGALLLLAIFSIVGIALSLILRRVLCLALRRIRLQALLN